MKKYILYTLAIAFTGLTATAQIDRSKMPTSGPTPEVSLGQADEFTLKNGLTVLVVNDTKLPSVSFSLNLNTPPVYEGSKAGVQSLTGALLGKETQETSKDDFSEKTDFLGARINLNTSGGFGFCLSKYTEDVFSLFAEAALRPKFTQEELDFEKDQLIENIKSGENSAAAIAGNVRGALAYGKNHAAGEIITEETISNVTLQDVNDFYTARFKPSNGYMVFTGDITTKEAKKLLKKYFKGWEKGMVATENYPEVADVTSTVINFVDVPNAVQTELAVMNMSSLKMNDADYHAALVANYIYGGAFGSYLNINLREAKGYTYGARSSLGTGKYYKSTFRATTKVRNEVTDSAVVETLKEMKRIRTTDVDAEMLKNAKAKFLGSFILESEDKTVSARRTINVKTNDLPADFYKTFIEKINAVTAADVKRVANKYFKIDNARIVLVGKASDVIENVEKIEWDGKMIPVTYFDKDANPVDRPVFNKPLPAGVTINTVQEAYLKAVGGRDAASKVETVVIQAGATMQGMQLGLESKTTKKRQNKVVVSLGGNAMQTIVFNNGKGHMVVQGQKLDNSDAQNAQAAMMAQPFIELSETKATLVGIESIDGKDAYKVDYGNGVLTFYNMETGLKMQDVTTASMMGQEMTTTIKFSNYKEVNGVKYPHTITQALGPQELKFEVSKVMVNEGVSEEDFN